MSTQSDQRSSWTPAVIATIVYRVVMIIVSIAFIWKKYRRPTRQFDGESLIGILISPHRTQASLLPSTEPPPRFASPRSLRAVSSNTPQGSSTTQRDYRMDSWERRAQYECSRRRTSSSQRSFQHSTDNGNVTNADV
ncbi:hypothetical protein BDZ45DRAFT_691670 [Acephala macrosclerotiorum]|nr:hypothetical protein BDZ45DRAFT_691670 [Acephala macrosclerotiorum]